MCSRVRRGGARTSMTYFTDPQSTMSNEFLKTVDKGFQFGPAAEY